MKSNIKRLIGGFILGSAIAVPLGFIVSHIGFKAALICFGGAAGIVSLIFIGLILLFGE